MNLLCKGTTFFNELIQKREVRRKSSTTEKRYLCFYNMNFLMEKYILNNQWLELSEIQSILDNKKKIELGDQARKAIIDCRNYLDAKIENEDALFYGINTGFGSLCDTAISKEDLSLLQRNLVVSHDCGTGNQVELNTVKCMLLLKIIGLAKGHSGIRLETIERLVFFYNEDILPIT